MGWGKNLRVIRKKKGLRLIDLAVKSGVEKNTISRIEREEQEPQPSTKMALALAIDMKPEEIEDLSPKKDTPKLSQDELLDGVRSLWLAGDLTIEQIMERLYLERRQDEEDGDDDSK